MGFGCLRAFERNLTVLAKPGVPKLELNTGHPEKGADSSPTVGSGRSFKDLEIGRLRNSDSRSLLLWSERHCTVSAVGWAGAVEAVNVPQPMG